MKMNLVRQGLFALAICALPWGVAQAADYPDRPIRIVIPFAPGSGTDLIARTIARALSEDTGASVFIDNKPGGEGFIGSQTVAAATPDGYTLLLAGSSTQVVNVHLFKKLPYDPIRDFVPIAPLASTAMLLAVNGKASVKTAEDMIQLAKSAPGTLSFGSGSATTRLAGESLQQQAGIKLLHVPYRSPGLAINGLLGDQVNMVFIDLPTIAGHLENGSLRAIAVSGTARMPSQPQVPTLREAGLKDFDLTAWYGIWAPAGTPRPIVDKLHAMVETAMADPAVKKFFGNASMQTLGPMSPAQFGKFQLDETAKLGEVVRAAGIELQ
jgi:tripartite-type tricarboxylate transporter receptor subunit TctC